MNKTISCLLAMGLLFGGVFQQSEAQDKRLAFNLNAGALTDASFRVEVFTLGSGIDFLLGEHLMVSPEIRLWSWHFHFNLLQMNMGAILNYKLKNFFLGGGMSVRLFMTEEVTDVFGFTGPKLNVGVRTDRIRLTLYMLTPFDEFFEYIQYGANIGIVF